jgi:nucleotide-binding universal stress UspA family protein
MLKRILLLLAETKSSLCARKYAFQLAQSKQARITGLAGVDFTYLDAPMLGGVGTTGWQDGIERQFKTVADEARRRLHEIYEIECDDHGLDFEWLSFDGDPIEPLRLASETRDLLITSYDSGFGGEADKQPSEVISILLSMMPRPVIICPNELPANNDVLIAYDGSLPAMRALQMFVLLGIWRGARVHVTSIDASQELAARRTGGALAYLHVHGYEAEANPIASSLDPAAVLNIEVADRKIGTLVMGAYGHRGFLQFLLGSTTSALAENPPCALFVYH